MKAEILRSLREAGGYLSGQELCEKLNVSRTAVWKVIRQLEDEGYEIEAVRNRGYRLVESADVLSEVELNSMIGAGIGCAHVVFSEELDSTNTRAKQLAEAGVPDGTLVVADYQSAGKGRRGRSWSSPRGTGIWMSLLLRPQIPPERASMLTIVAALAVSEGIEKNCGLDNAIKWPNDIVINGKKICGILTEMSAQMDCVNHVVIGIGINANTREFPEEIRETATSLLIEKKAPVRRAALIREILSAWEVYYGKYLETQDLSLLVETYNERLVNRDREVKVLAPSGNYTGISRGITEDGELLVEREDGSVTKVLSGEVSVRGIYGYV